MRCNTLGRRPSATERSQLSDNREPVTAPDAPAAVGPYVHADPRRRPAVLLRPDPARSADRRSRRGDRRPSRRDAAWRTSRPCARRPGPRLGDAVRLTVYLTDMTRVRRGQRGLRVVLRVRSAGPGGDRRGGAAHAAPRSRSTRWWRSLTELAPRRAPVPLDDDPPRGAPPAPGSCPRDAGAQLADAERARRRATVALKAENLQRTGSFKLRGALAKIAALGDAMLRRGVVAGSAGNHAQAVAYAARARGVRCEVFMPEAAPIAKVEAASAPRRRRAPGRDERRRGARAPRASAPTRTGWPSSIRSTIRR